MRNPIASLPPWRLRLWLRGMPAETRVGTAQSCTKCVLAAWFSRIFGVPVSVGEMIGGVFVAIIAPDGARQVWPLAQWQVVLMQAVDDAADMSGTCVITARVALNHLARMQRVEGLVAA